MMAPKLRIDFKSRLRPDRDRRVPIDTSALPSPREIDMMAIGLFSKAFVGPLRKVTTEIKEGA
jgi:hypothetical protein